MLTTTVVSQPPVTLKKRVRGQCRFCPEIYKKFGDLIRHESTHIIRTPAPERETTKEPDVNIDTPAGATKGHDVTLSPERATEEVKEVVKSEPFCISPEVEAPSKGQLNKKDVRKTRAKRLNKSKSNPKSGSSKGRFKCQHCSETFTRRWSRTQHIRRKHRDIETDLSLRDTAKMQRAAKEALLIGEMMKFKWSSDFTEIKSTNFRCHWCSRIIRAGDPYTLKLHLMTEHTHETPFSSLCCDKTFVSSDKRNRHESAHLLHLKKVSKSKPRLISTKTSPIQSFVSSNKRNKHKIAHPQRGSKLKSKPRSISIKSTPIQTNDTAYWELKRNYDWEKDWKECVKSDGTKAYKCKHCQQILLQRNLLLHSFIHTGQRPFPCGYCDKKFRHPGNRNQHMTLHTGELKYPCDYCDLRLRTQNLRIEHQRLHTGETPYQCSICGNRFRISSSYSHHMSDHKKRYHTWKNTRKNQEFEQRNCLLDSINDKVVEIRILRAENDLSLSSKYSGAIGRLRELQNLKIEVEMQAEIKIEPSEIMNEQTSESEKAKGINPSQYYRGLGQNDKVECLICKIQIGKKSKWRHDLKHKGVKFTCNECGQNFSRPDALLRHKMRAHSEKRRTPIKKNKSILRRKVIKEPDGPPILSRELEICPEIKLEPPILEISAQIQDDSSQFKTLTCKYCSKSFGRRQHLRRHELLIHIQPKPKAKPKPKRPKTKPKRKIFDMSKYFVKKGGLFQCLLCQRGIKFKHNLPRHYNLAHTGKFPCNQCNRRYNLKANLDTHMSIFHTRAVRKAFREPSNPGINFPCTLCSRSYKRKDNLKRHQQSVHSPYTTPYSCPTCGYLYKRENGLTMHELQVHKYREGCERKRKKICMLKTPILCLTRLDLENDEKLKSDFPNLFNQTIREAPLQESDQANTFSLENSIKFSEDDLFKIDLAINEINL